MRRIHTAKYFLSVTIAVLFLCSCAANKTASTTDAAADEKITINMEEEKDADATGVSATNNNSLALVDYLRRIPGLQIEERGSTVNIMIRGMSSVSGNNGPLFVINNSAIGNSYADAVSAVDVNDIKNVNVMKGPEGQQMYGMRGANGVIQIFTKKK